MAPRIARRVLRCGARGLLACAAAVLAACASDSIAPSYPGTLVLVADDAANELVEIEPNGGHVRNRYAVAGPVVAIAIARNGQYAATIDAGGDVVVCEVPRQGRDAAWRVAGPGRATGIVFADRRSTLAASFAGSGDVVLLTRESGRVEAHIATGTASVVALALARESGQLLAACSGPPSIVRLDVDGRRVIGRIALESAPIALVAGEDEHSPWWKQYAGASPFDWEAPVAVAGDFAGHVLVASARRTGDLLVAPLDAIAEPLRIHVAAPDDGTERGWPVAVDPDGRNAFVSIPLEGRVVVVDLRTNRVRGEYRIGGRPGVIAWTFQRAQSADGLDGGVGIGVGVGH